MQILELTKSMPGDKVKTLYQSVVDRFFSICIILQTSTES